MNFNSCFISQAVFKKKIAKNQTLQIGRDSYTWCGSTYVIILIYNAYVDITRFQQSRFMSFQKFYSVIKNYLQIQIQHIVRSNTV